MEMFVIRILIETMRLALNSGIRANHVADADQMYRELDKLASNLIIMGAISTAVTIFALVRLPEKNIDAYPLYLHVFIMFILGLITVSGLIGINSGMYLLVVNNPTRPLAMVILWISCVGAALAIGILLLSLSSS